MGVFSPNQAESLCLINGDVTARKVELTRLCQDSYVIEAAAALFILWCPTSKLFQGLYFLSKLKPPERQETAELALCLQPPVEDGASLWDEPRVWTEGGANNVLGVWPLTAKGGP